MWVHGRARVEELPVYKCWCSVSMPTCRLLISMIRFFSSLIIRFILLLHHRQKRNGVIKGGWKIKSECILILTPEHILFFRYFRIMTPRNTQFFRQVPTINCQVRYLFWQFMVRNCQENCTTFELITLIITINCMF